MSYVRIDSPPLIDAASQPRYPPLSQPNTSQTEFPTSSYPNMQAAKGRLTEFIPHMYPSKPKAMTPTRRKALLLSYAPDWAITLILAACFFALDKVNGYRREFSLTDTSIRYPFALHERVPNGPLYLIVFVIPIILQPIINFLTVRSWWDFHNSSLGLILGLALTGATTQFIKISVGRPRPDIISRCIPPAGAVDPPFGLSNWTICTQPDDSLLNEGFRSFPSGHTSMSFAGLGFLAFYLAGKLHLFDSRGHAGKAWVSLFPFFGAAMVGISRTMDYRHHWQDVTVGAIVGIVFSFFAYRQYYPSLSSEVSHRPYSPRIKESGSSLLPTNMTSANTTAYNPNLGSFPPSNRYSYSPSPPPPPKNTFQGNNASSALGYEQVKLGVDGTVPRPAGPGSMEEVWKEGEHRGFDGTVPRPKNAEHGGDDELNTVHSHLSTREQQPQQQQRPLAASSPLEPQDSYSIPLRTTSHPQQTPTRESQQYGRDGAYGGI